MRKSHGLNITSNVLI